MDIFILLPWYPLLVGVPYCLTTPQARIQTDLVCQPARHVPLLEPGFFFPSVSTPGLTDHYHHILRPIANCLPGQFLQNFRLLLVQR